MRGGGDMSERIKKWRVRWMITITDGEPKSFPVEVKPVGAATAAEAVAWVLGVSMRQARKLLRDKIVQAEEIQ
jgi:hypothetical protein